MFLRGIYAREHLLCGLLDDFVGVFVGCSSHLVLAKQRTAQDLVNVLQFFVMLSIAQAMKSVAIVLKKSYKTVLCCCWNRVVSVMKMRM